MAKPNSFIKWAGGKRWLINHLTITEVNRFNCYFEPFLGGGAIFFHFQPRKAVISDINKDLINTYKIVKRHPYELLEALKKHQKKHSKDYYYQIRGLVPSCHIQRAARFIYLNKACWNGLYRVNSQGEFNVPIGTNQNIVNGDTDFAHFSKLLSNTRIECCDFNEIISEAGKGDLIFADPPYTTKHNTNGFISYNEKIFTWRDQERLAGALEKAAKRGASILATNANHKSIRDLYSFADIEVITRKSVISSNPRHRGKTSELVIKANL